MRADFTLAVADEVLVQAERVAKKLQQAGVPAECAHLQPGRDLRSDASSACTCTVNQQTHSRGAGAKRCNVCVAQPGT